MYTIFDKMSKLYEFWAINFIFITKGWIFITAESEVFNIKWERFDINLFLKSRVCIGECIDNYIAEHGDFTQASCSYCNVPCK